MGISSQHNGDSLAILRIIMRSFIVFLVLSLTVLSLAKKGNGGKANKAMCLSEEDGKNMMKICHAGSTLGEKAEAAMEACAIKAESRAKKGKGKKPNKGKGKGKKPTKCPKFDEIMQWAEEEYAGEVCMFNEMGWMDNEMNANEDLIQAAIDTLPADIADALNGEEYETCYNKAIKKMAKMAPKCDSKYSEDEIAQLEELADGVAHSECFMAVFKKSCGDYVMKTLASAAAAK